MNRELERELIRMLTTRDVDDVPVNGTEGRLTVSHYRDAAHLDAELSAVFGRSPMVAAHVSSVSKPGDLATATLGAVPVIVVHGRDGAIRAFINACRHRGARLSSEPTGHSPVLICPYHGWAYNGDGSLRAIPHEKAFASVDPANCGLVELDKQVSGGFVWVSRPGDRQEIEAWLAGVGDDLEYFGLADHRSRLVRDHPVDANWKLVMDAFSEGYHLKTLHRTSVRRFFHDRTVFDRLGRHSRSVGARREIDQAEFVPPEDWDFRAWTTAFYNVFPNTILVFHPDWVSRITMQPTGPETSVARHEMLVHNDAVGSEDHWDKTFSLIHDQVFAAEDLWIVSEIQATVHSGADEYWPLGTIESPLAWFHQACADALADQR